MSRKIYSGTTQFVAAGATKNLHKGPGKIHQIIASDTGATPSVISLYDSAGATTPILLVITVAANSVCLNFPIPLVFTTGLTVVTAADNRCFVITEAQE